MTTNQTSTTRKRYAIHALLAAGSIGFGVWGVAVSMSPETEVRAAGAAHGDPLSEMVYSNTQMIRREMGLRTKDLAALGVTQAGCEAVLGRLAAWCETNEAQIDVAQRAVYTAERSRELLERKIRTGQANEAEINDRDTAAEAVATAVTARQALLQQGAAYAMQGAPAQTTEWQRMVALDTNSDLKYVSSVDALRFEQLRSDAEQRGLQLEQVLSFNEQQALKALRQQAVTGLAAVQAAEVVALPLPESLQAPPE